MSPPPPGSWVGAGAYEAYVGRWSRSVAPPFLDRLGVPEGRRWLDVGCGTGALSQAILTARAPVEVLGVDPSPAFVAHAAAHTTDARAAFREGDAEHLPVETGSFDAVVSGLVLNFLPDRSAALREMRRAARPDGVVAAYVWDYADGMQLIRHFWDAAVEAAPDAVGLREDLRFPVCRPEPLRELFRDAGLADCASGCAPGCPPRTTGRSGSPPGRGRCAAGASPIAEASAPTSATAGSTGKPPIHRSPTALSCGSCSSEGRPRPAPRRSRDPRSTPRSTVSATEITVIGNVVNSPARNRTQNGSVTNFRVAATERRFDSAKQEWGDGSTFFVDVECWGELGGNVSHSISKGDPVVVVGAIRTHEWESDQGRRSRPQIRAEAVAPNLARGVADFRKTQRTAQPDFQGSEVSADTSATPTADEIEDLVAGRDYEGADTTLDDENPADRFAEPANA